MKTITADPLFQVQNTLGEGPLWHPAEKRLYWVDINPGIFYQSDQALTAFNKFHMHTPVGAFGFRSGGGMILATADGFSWWQEGQAAPQVFYNPLPGREGVRLNDGKVDPAGRFWAGSIDTEQSQGKLYRLDPDGTQHTILKGIGISNGLGWSPDRETMYYTDSLQSTIYAFDYNLGSGEIRNQRPFVQLPKTKKEVVPDGLCVDAEGCLWSAQWNGWQIVRYDPQGRPILKVKVPVQRVTACCFGGERLDHLFITTARVGLAEDALGAQNHAGDVFVCPTDTRGQKTNFFGQPLI
jgi:L-arabinonolactonase